MQIEFKHLNIVAPILEALKTTGYTHPTPIQEQAIPLVLGRKDVLGCAQTGTGKTAAFAIPILQLLNEKLVVKAQKKIATLVLTPTRELAIQIGESFTTYGQYLKIKNLVIFGGVSQGQQTNALKAGVDILVATPGRLLDLMQQGFISLSDIEIFVLDEADRMLDMGFIHDVKKIIAKLPSKRQTLFFSATMPTEIKKLSDTILNHPEKIAITPVSTTAETVQQSLYFVDQKEKKHLLIHLINEKNIERLLVFARTKHGSDKLVKDLQKANISAAAIHGNKSQNARQRALNDFKEGKIRVLVATDIAARGIDIEELSHVVNFDLSDVPETYVHRIGRTGRAMHEGTAIAFCDVEEMDNLKNIQKLIGFKIPVVDNHPFYKKERNVHPAKELKNNKPVNSKAAIAKKRYGSNNRNTRFEPHRKETSQRRMS